MDSKFDENHRIYVEDKIKTCTEHSFQNIDTYLGEPFSEEEIARVCVELKCGKAGGLDGTVPEHFKYGGNTLF